MLEGLAVYSSNQMGTGSYPGKAETYSLISNGNFIPPGAYKIKNEDNIRHEVPNKTNFIYSEFACIVDYLTAGYGRDKFLIYIKSLINDNNHDIAFRKIYSIDFETFLNKFRTHVSHNSQLCIIQ